MQTKGRWELAGANVQVLVSSRDTCGRYAICEVEIGGGLGAPLHRHSYEDELFFVLEGEFLFEVGGEAVRAPKGASVFAPKGEVHTFRNVGETEGRLLLIAHPGGLDLFIQELGTLIRGDPQINRAKLEAVLEKHGITVI